MHLGRMNNYRIMHLQSALTHLVVGTKADNRSSTSQEIVWQITRGFNPEESKKLNLEERSPFLEVGTLMGRPCSDEEERMLKDLPPFFADAVNFAKGMGDPRESCWFHCPLTHTSMY